MVDQALIEFFRRLDRAYFIDNEFKAYADLDRALPIGYGQTISQPSLVLEMTCHLALNKQCKVLEIGTGSGYQTALLAEFSGTVYTVERLKVLADKAREKLTALGYTNIVFKTGDGSAGWKERGPFDRIIVTAASEKVPEELIEQLDLGGRLIIPVGSPALQDLLLLTKNETGDVQSKILNKVVFVELVGKYGWSE
jgi:protein-L-isoaspartate(D-aspartate) O-methyltransferase